MSGFPEGAVVLAGDFRDLKQVKVVQRPKAAGVKFTKVHEWDSETMWISAPLHNGDWAYRFVIVLQDWREATGDDTESKWNVTLNVVSPQAAGLRAVRQALKSSGFGDDFFAHMKKASKEERELVLAEELAQYGTKARLTDEYGNNQRVLLREAREEALKASSLFGFYMDRTQNAFGDSGWDFISGNIAGSKDRDHRKWLEAKGLTEEEFEAKKEKRAEDDAKTVSVPVRLEPYVDGKKPMPLDKAHALWREGKIEFVERFVGGFADRGGYWHGPDERKGPESEDSYGQTTVGDPQDVLPVRRKQDTKARFICSIDEQGQFQTYWSLWRIK